MKIKNILICISLLIILLNISCVFATQEIDTNDTLTADDTTINEVSDNVDLQGNVVSVESDLSNRLGSANDENLLSKDNHSQSDDSVLAAKNTVSTQLITPNRVVYVSNALNGYDYSVILKDKNGKVLSGKKVSFSFNGKTQTSTTDKSGWAKVKLIANAQGAYGIEVAFAGDSDYAAISQNATIKLVKENTKFIAPNRLFYVKDVADGYTYSAILKTKDGSPLANKKVLLTIGTKKQVVMTDGKGYANFNIKLDTPGTHVLNLKFAGTISCYNGADENRKMNLILIPTKLVAPNRIVSIYEVANGYTYPVILKDKDGSPLVNKKITITINGKKFTGKTDKTGWANIAVIATKDGSNDVDVTFEGDNYYRTVTEHRTIKLVDTGNPYGKKAKKVWINSDMGSDDMKNEVARLLRQNGWTVHVGDTDSNAHYVDYFKVTSDYQAYITLYNGFCAGTVREAYSSSIQNTLKQKGVTLVIMWDTRDWTNPQGMAPYRYGDFKGYNASRAWDDNFSVGDPSINDVDGYLRSNDAKYCAYPSAEGLVAQFLAGGYLAMHP